MTLSLDTETTGLDFRHGARPFLVTSCSDRGTVTFWEWDVNPLTREVVVPPEDLFAVRTLVVDCEEDLVLQNPKFDCAALAAVDPSIGEGFPWDRVRDTLRGGHLLASNLPHDLTSMAYQYLGEDIKPFEDEVERCTQAARRLARSRHPTWAIAREGREDMPSAGEKTWKIDMWLPRALAREEGYPEPDPGCDHEYGHDFLCRRCGGHRWWTVTRDYANTDSAVTLALWTEMYDEIHRRGLWDVYRDILKVTPVAGRMEAVGVTYSGARRRELGDEYRAESARLGLVLVNIAADFGHDLTLPRNGVNNSLRELMLDRMGLEPVRNPGARTSAPTLNKAAMEHYLITLPPRSKEHRFVKTLLGKRRRDTALSYMDGYDRFRLPTDNPDFFRLHPNLNPTGTDTLRWSCSNPNEQNISAQGTPCPDCDGTGEDCVRCGGRGIDPRSLRYCFGPAPRREWYSKDARNIELRIPFYESGEPALIDLFERPDDPPYYGSNHLANFHAVYEDLWSGEIGLVCDRCCGGRRVDVTLVGPHCKKKFGNTWYKCCKNGGFAKQYGGQRRKVDSTFRRAGAFDLLDAKFGRLAELNARQVAFARKHGYVETLPDRSVDPRRGYPLLCTRTERGILETVPLNYHVQGSAMWWMCKAMVRVNAFYSALNRGETFAGRRWPGGYHLVMQVHDELVSDMPSGPTPEYNLPVVREAKRLMELGGDDIGIPIPVGVERHDVHWGEGVTVAV